MFFAETSAAFFLPKRLLPKRPESLEVLGSLGESGEVFITRLCKMLCRSHDDQRAGSFLKQRISMALQIGSSACVLGTVSDRDAFKEITKSFFFKKLYHCSFKKNSTGRLR